MIIVGAGLAGLIAAHMFPTLPVIETAETALAGHRALLRFRSDTVAKVTGIDFRRVMVQKGIWAGMEFVAPSIRLANMYSIKCHGKALPDRSIWRLDAAERFIAPETFYEQLLEAVGPRVSWAQRWDFSARSGAISTAPLPAVLEALGIVPGPEIRFDRQPITVRRFRVPGWDVFQTVYFPEGTHTMYRASMTGDLLICEFIGEPEGSWQTDVELAFALADYEFIESSGQRFGKIAPVNDTFRKQLIARLTTEHNIFSLGRFATWRNILLDDVVNDALVIKRLITASPYERRLAAL